MSVIMTKEGKPFETEQAANLRSGVLKKNNIITTVVKVEGGYALRPIVSRGRLTPGTRSLRKTQKAETRERETPAELGRTRPST